MPPKATTRRADKAEALVTAASVEHGIGKVFYEFFLACFNVTLYYRGLHSPKFFSHKLNPTLGIQVPYMRFPESVAYLEKVAAKATNYLMANLLQAVVFEERDADGQLTLTNIRYDGEIYLTPHTCYLFNEYRDIVRENCSELVGELKRTFENAHKPHSSTPSKWKVLLVVQRSAKCAPGSSSSAHQAFSGDPDISAFPWTIIGGKDEEDMSASKTVRECAEELRQIENRIRLFEDASRKYVNDGENMIDMEDFGDPSNDSMEDNPLDESMENADEVRSFTEYEKEGFSVIRYEDDENDNGPGSPELFPSSECQSIPPSPVCFHLDSTVVKTEQQHDNCTETTDQNQANVYSKKNFVINDVDVYALDSQDGYTPLSGGNSSSQEVDNVTTMFEEYRDFEDLDKVFDETSPSPTVPPEALSPSKSSSSEPKLYVVATKVILSTLVINILIVTKKVTIHRNKRLAKMLKSNRSVRRRLIQDAYLNSV